MHIAGHHRVNYTAQSGQGEPWPTAAILSFGIALPPHGVAQTQIGEWMATSLEDSLLETSSLGKRRAMSRFLRSLYANSGIEMRYSCCSDYLQPPTASRFAPGRSHDNAPTTAERMVIYAREAPPLGLTAARRAVEAYAAKSDINLANLLASITHLVVVSCTGFFAPGLDFAVARDLGLAPTVQRTLIGFMGCSAAFNALRSAYQIVRSQPEARVLVLSVELCSLHTQPNPTREQLVVYSLFADGAAACLVGQPQPGEGDFFQLEGFHTSTKPDTGDEMVWEIGDYGFTLQLSPKVPHHLAEIAPAALQALFADARPHFWAIHPGGRAIVDRLAQIFDLAPDQVAASRTVLRDYGNLSSATILFVLDELRRTLRQERQQAAIVHNGHTRAIHKNGIGAEARSPAGVAMAFGPGLVIEMARLAYVPVSLNTWLDDGRQTQAPSSIVHRPSSKEGMYGNTA